MWWGQPYCQSCGYEGPDFMWSWHHFMGMSVLLQDTTTLELRDVHVDDHEIFYERDSDDIERRRETYVAEFVGQRVRAGERCVPIKEFVGRDNDETQLPCPKCGSLLFWQTTGIS